MEDLQDVWRENREYLREILVYFGLVIIKRKTMKFIQILAALLLFNFITISSYAKNIAPEVTLKEEDFAYNQYKVELEDLNKVLEHCSNNKNNKKRDWETKNLLIPNLLTRFKGYGLLSQRDILRLRLENANLKGEKKEVIINLKQELKKIDEQIKKFFSENIWVD